MSTLPAQRSPVWAHFPAAGSLPVPPVWAVLGSLTGDTGPWLGLIRPQDQGVPASVRAAVAPREGVTSWALAAAIFNLFSHRTWHASARSVRLSVPRCHRCDRFIETERRGRSGRGLLLAGVQDEVLVQQWVGAPDRLRGSTAGSGVVGVGGGGGTRPCPHLTPQPPSKGRARDPRLQVLGAVGEPTPRGGSRGGGSLCVLQPGCPPPPPPLSLLALWELQPKRGGGDTGRTRRGGRWGGGCSIAPRSRGSTALRQSLQ